MERLQREFALIKNRGGEEAIKGRNKGKAEAINDILGVADNFERAAAAISPETDGERAVVAHYKGIYDTLMDCLEKLGLEEVENVSSVLRRYCFLFSSAMSVSGTPMSTLPTYTRASHSMSHANVGRGPIR